MLTFFTECTEDTLRDLNPDVSDGAIKEVFQLTLQGYDARRDRGNDEVREDDDGLYVGTSVYTNTYGADANAYNLATTNEAAAHDDLEDYETYTFRGELCVLICTPEGVILEDALDAAREIREALEDSPTLDEEAYCNACHEDAVEGLSDAISDIVRDLDAELVQDLEDAGLDADDVLDAAISEGLVEWYEEECWPRIDPQEAQEALTTALQVATQEAFQAARDDRTIDMDFA
jgi:uncharacterized Zn finger protein